MDYPLFDSDGSGLTQQQREAIEVALFGGNKIGAIKLYREATGRDLATAKKEIEVMMERLREVNPERFSAVRGGKNGCLGLLLLPLAGIAGLILSW